MHLSENLKRLLKNLDDAGFSVERGVFESDDLFDASHDYRKGKIAYKRILETLQFDNTTSVLTPISTISLKLYIPPNSEKIEKEFFKILKQSQASYDIEDFDVYVSNDLVVHTLVVSVN